MKYIDNIVTLKLASLSMTRVKDSAVRRTLLACVSYAKRLNLEPMNVHGNAQETLTREKRRCGSRRKLMFPHFFVRANGSLRT